MNLHSLLILVRVPMILQSLLILVRFPMILQSFCVCGFLMKMPMIRHSLLLSPLWYLTYITYLKSLLCGFLLRMLRILKILKILRILRMIACGFLSQLVSGAKLSTMAWLTMLCLKLRIQHLIWLIKQLILPMKQQIIAGIIWMIQIEWRSDCAV